MGADLVKHGVHPGTGESRRNPRLEPQGRSQEEPLQRSAASIEIARRFAGWCVAHRLERAALVDEPGGFHGTVPHEPAFAIPLLHEKRELVSGLEVAVEIDLAAEDGRERHRELRRLTRGRCRGKQRGTGRVDRLGDDHALGTRLVGHDRRVEGVRLGGTRRDAQESPGVDFVLEVPHAPVESPLEAPGLPGSHVPRLEDVRHRGQDAGNVRLVHVVPGQHAAERRAPRYAAWDDLAVGGQDDVEAGRDRHGLGAVACGGAGTRGQDDRDSDRDVEHHGRTASLRAARRQCQTSQGLCPRYPDRPLAGCCLFCRAARGWTAMRAQRVQNSRNEAHSGPDPAAGIRHPTSNILQRIPGSRHPPVPCL